MREIKKVKLISSPRPGSGREGLRLNMVSGFEVPEFTILLQK